MALYHFSGSVISRGGGRSAVAAAAYRHCARMSSEREGSVADYSRKGGMVHEEFALPHDAPLWARALVSERTVSSASEAFWNRVELFEKRKDAQLAKEFVLALPLELDRDQNIALMRDFIAQEFLPRGLIADWVYHDIQSNPHVHLMTNLRPLVEDGFGGKKVAVLDELGEAVRSGDGKIVYGLWAGGRDDFASLRASFAAVQNAHLERHGFDVRVDHRSYADQGIDLEPGVKLGVRAHHIALAAEAEGRVADLERLRVHEAVRVENASRIERRPELVLDAVSREKSVFDRRDVAKVLHRSVDDSSQFQNLMARVFASDELVLLAGEGVDPVTGAVCPARYATRAMVTLEAGMAVQAEHLAGADGFGVAASVRDGVLSRHVMLSAEQRAGLERITGAERIAALVGRAGAGKTTLMKAAREVWEASGYRVVGAALAGKAAEGLEKEAGISSRTLASWQKQWERGQLALDERTVFVLDEAGMVSSRQMALFVDAVSASGAKLVLIGDADQLQPIEAGAAFRSLTDIIGYGELSTIYRQHEPWMREASLCFAKGMIGSGLEAYEQQGRVHACEGRDASLRLMIGDWLKDHDPAGSSLMLAYLRRDVRALNEMARSALLERGLIEEGHAFQTEDGVRHFACGDQIVFLRNEGSLGVKNGMIGRVVSSSPGKLVAEIGEDRRHVSVDGAFYRNLDHGYATTVHKSQGATVDRVKVFATPSLDRHLSYVAMTRHRHGVDLYYDRVAMAKAGGLVACLSKCGSKETTLDFAGSQLYGQALDYATRRGLDGARVAKAFAQNQLRWLGEQRAKLRLLGERLVAGVKALGFGERAVQSSSVEATAPLAPSVPLFKGIETWSSSVGDAVEAKLQSDRGLAQSWRDLRQRVGFIYERPEEAMQAMKLVDVLSGSDESRQAAHADLSAQLARDPSVFGALRGKTGLFASSSAKAERQRALSNVSALPRNLGNHARLRSEGIAKYTAQIERMRSCSQVAVPSLSAPATLVLEKMAAAVERNEMGEAVRLASADAGIKAELDGMAKALEARFGPEAFKGSVKAQGEAYEKAGFRVAEGDRSKLVASWPLFHALQRTIAHDKVQQMMQNARARAQTQDKGITR